MKPNTVLVSTGCDLRRLPLDASEVFLLSRLDGQLTLEEIGEIAGFEFDKARRLAERLIILGAAKPLGGGKSMAPKGPAADPMTTGVRRRFDPRSDEEEDSTPRVDRFEAKPASVPKRQSIKPQPVQPKRRSTKSMKAQRAAMPPPAPPAEEICELDLTTQEKIKALDLKLKTVDYYTALGVARDADKKDIKRAYFALAAVWHPDRFFGKKLGSLRAPLERCFVKLTEANDALGTKAKRDAYDATLPPESKRRTVAPPKQKTIAPPREKTIAPPKQKTIAPPKQKTVAPPRMPSAAKMPSAGKMPSSARKLSRKLRKSLLAMAAAQPAPVPTDDKLRRLQQQAKDLAGRVKAEPWIKAAEDAIKSNDILGAANNYRLALQMHDDPIIRDKLDAIDRMSRDLKAEKYAAKARAAERGDHWAEAADHYARANEARKDAAIAERAAYCLVRANGDLRQATALAEQAVSASTRNVDYRLTLAEVFAAAKLLVRAKEECDAALELQPDNVRAKALHGALKKS